MVSAKSNEAASPTPGNREAQIREPGAPDSRLAALAVAVQNSQRSVVRQPAPRQPAPRPPIPRRPP